MCVRVVSGSSVKSVFEVRPRRASELAVCSGTRKGLESPRVLVGTPCSVAAPSDPVGSILVKILQVL